MRLFWGKTNFRFGYNWQQTTFCKLHIEAVHKDGTGCDRNIHGEQQEKDNV